jgi:hypothetical protein
MECFLLETLSNQRKLSFCEKLKFSSQCILKSWFSDLWYRAVYYVVIDVCEYYIHYFQLYGTLLSLYVSPRHRRLLTRLYDVTRTTVEFLNALLTVHHSSLYQYSETNVMYFLFNLLRIKGLYMFRTILVHPQETLHKQHLVYCVRVMSVGCTRIGVELVAPILVQPTDITRTQYTKCRLCSASWGGASNARNM